VIGGNELLWKRMCSRYGFATDGNASAVPSAVCADCCTQPLSLSTEQPSATADQSLGSKPHHNYKNMFVDYWKSFADFIGGKSLVSCKISRHSNRVTAIDYHNGYVATGGETVKIFFLNLLSFIFVYEGLYPTWIGCLLLHIITLISCMLA